MKEEKKFSYKIHKSKKLWSAICALLLVLTFVIGFPGAEKTYAALAVGQTWTVVYHPNGGSGYMADQSMVYGTATQLRANTYTKTGYRFAGWYRYIPGVANSGTDGYEKFITQVQNKLNSLGYNCGTADGWWGEMSIAAMKRYQQAKGLYVDGSVGPQTYESLGLGHQLNNQASVRGLTEGSYGSSVTIMAKWVPNTYTVAYNGNGATGGSTASSSHTYDVAKNLTANGFTKTGHTFQGWATSASGAKVYNNSQSVVNLTSTHGATVTLYAKWTANTYTITYNANGGTGAPASQSYTYASSGTINLQTGKPTRTGYTFLGWSLSNTATTASYSPGQAWNKSNANNYTLYAVWKANTYTITYNANGGTGAPASQSYTYASSGTINLQTGTPTRTGYTFLGWSLQNNATTASYSPGQAWNKSNASNYTLYAVWRPNTYTITLNNQSATTAGTTVYYEKYNTGKYSNSACSVAISTITIPQKTYSLQFHDNDGTTSFDDLGVVLNYQGQAIYHFDGYYGNTAGTGTQYIAANGSITASNTAFSANTTLYAKWSGGGFKLPNGTKPDYTFTGWYSDSDCTQKVGNAGDIIYPTQNMQLYAKYVANVYQITLDNADATTNGSDKYFQQFDNGMYLEQTLDTVAKSNDVPSGTAITIPARAYTITYNGNGGTPERASDNYAYSFVGYFLE